MRHVAFLAALLFVAGAGAGVGGCTLALDVDDHTGVPTIGPVEASDYCEVLSQIVCEANQRCCERALRAPSVAACQEVVRPGCIEGLGEVLVDARVGYDAAQVGIVFAEGVALAEACSTELAQWADSPDGLARGFQGTLAIGDVCTPNAIDDFAAFFSCRDAACVPESLTTWTCAPQVAFGGDCVLDTDCAAGLFCEREGLVQFEGTCQPLRADDQPCNRDEQCASTVCNPGGACARLDQTNLYCFGFGIE